MKNNIIFGDALDVLKQMPDGIVNTCVTSPPYYGLRDYGVEGQIGLEETPEEYVKKLVSTFREVKRVLRDDGTLWLNIGDSYAGSGKGGAFYPESTLGTKQATNKGTIGKPNLQQAVVPQHCKPKDLMGIPWMLAFALRNDGWYLRQDIIWHKTNPMPEPVKDRCTKSHEYIFLLSKSRKYYFDSDSIKEPAKYPNDNRGARKDSRRGTECNSMSGKTGKFRNKRDVWTISTKPCKEAHFAVFPPDLVEPCILAGCPQDGFVLDPFIGSGTTGMVAKTLGRNYIGIDLNSDYKEIQDRKIG